MIRHGIPGLGRQAIQNGTTRGIRLGKKAPAFMVSQLRMFVGVV